MKKSHTIRTFATGFLAALFLVGIVPSALAAVSGKGITVYPGISIYIDDQKLNPTDANGKPVEVFTYNGTTYLPVRAVSEALGQPVQWDGSTRSVYVGKHSGTKPAAWLSQMDYFSGTSSNHFRVAPTDQDNEGTTHSNCIIDNFDRTYKLNGQYSRLTGVFYQRYDYRSLRIDRGEGLTIYGDGIILYDNTASQSFYGLEPDNISLDLTGVLELRVVLYGGPAGVTHPLAVGDMALWT